MNRKLQQNFDIIQYLIKDVSTEQLLWRNRAVSPTLGEIIDRLCQAEQWHQAALANCEVKMPVFDLPASGFDVITPTINSCNCMFETYASYRRQTVAVLTDIIDPQAQTYHHLFGKTNLSALVTQIDAYDQSHIHQIKEIIRCLPLNPLLARAIYEIDVYHHRYQSHLSQAKSLLDIGVGTGLALRYVIQHNSQLHCAGVDVRDLRLPDIKVPLQLYNGHTLPFANNQFDVSLLFYVLHHCQDPAQVLGEAVRVTRQKLIIIEEFDLPNADELSLDITERYGHSAIGLPPDLPYQLFNKPDFEAMLAARPLIEVDQQLLPSRTTRPVQKFLYVTQLAKP